jgi:imidazole glycerol-phosphate synthase subunit HisH
MISVINYGMGNVGSIVNMLKKMGVESILIDTPEQLLDAQKIVLPGVGAFDNAVKRLMDLELYEAIKQTVQKGIPLLGICLGMQLLGTTSEEGELLGLDLIPGNILRFESESGIKIPHMGWNSVQYTPNQIFQNLAENKFYFVHSYYFQPTDPNYSIAKTHYGLSFTSVINKDHIYGVQFHPEKSHKYGMQLLRNFSLI